MITLTWYGHACFEIKTGNTTLLIDPFLNDNPVSPVKASEVNPDGILITHGHGDHIGDTLEIAQRTGAMVVSNFEIHNWLMAKGLKNVHPMHIGGGFDFPWGRVKLTIAHHGSSLPDGSYGGSPAGLLLTLEGKKIYHAGDTGLFYDMKLIGEEGLDLAILPVGDNFTMGPEDALKAVKLLSPKRVIPIHYNTFDVIAQDLTEWSKQIEIETEAATQAMILQPGGSVTLA
jgi:L-ascorbate metabolism protein UlaG (beta-lactamase superfamily)